MLDDAKKIISEFVLPQDKIAVAVSGGADSVCLLHLTVNCGIDKKNIYVINFNHNIRGDESEKDSQFVGKLCKKLNVPFYGFSENIPAWAKKNGKSVETQAREWRYEVFERFIKDGVKFILTAHHTDDDVESILMHLFRGSGLNGLCGMRILSRNHYLRPLLTTKRAEIEEYIAKNCLEFVTDSTNADSNYTRNFVRNELIPLIKTRWQGADSAIISLKEEVTAVTKRLENSLDETLILEKEDGLSINIDALKKDTVTAPLFVMKALSKSGVKTDFSRVNINEILSLADKRNGAKLEMFGITVYKEYENLFFTNNRKNDKPVNADNAISAAVPFKEGRLSLNGKEILITCDESVKNEITKNGSLTENDSISKSSLIENSRLEVNGCYPIKILFCDINKIPPSAVLRTKCDGDIFKPFGGGHKKLKEYLIDKKIPKRLRDGIPLIANGNEILAVIGYEISDLIKADKNAKRCFIINRIN